MPFNPAQRLDSLQVLRFFAAFLVLCGHLVQEGVEFGFLPKGALDLLAYFPWAAGVDIFFVISGFIMFYIAAGEFGKAGAQGRFLKRRIVRLAPLYWFFTVAMLAAILLFPTRISNSAIDWVHVVASFAFIPWQSGQELAQPVLALGWTLNYEVFFYILFSFALLLPARVGVIALGGVLMGLSLLHTAVPSAMVQIHFWTNPIILEFLFGILLAAGFVSGWRMTHNMAIVGLTAGFAGLVFGNILALQLVDWRFALHGIPAALIVMSAVCLTLEPANAGSKTLVRLGDASYALYLSHPFSVNIVALIVGKLGVGFGWLFLPIGLVAALVVSVIVFLIIERPLLGWLKHRRDNAQTNATAGAG